MNVEKAFTTLSTEIKSKVVSRPGGGEKPRTGSGSGPTTLKLKPEGEKKAGCCWLDELYNWSYFPINQDSV